MEKKSFLKYVLALFGVTICVYLSFRFLLPLILPFIFAFSVIYLLMPVMDYLHDKQKWHRTISHYGLLLFILLLTICLVSFLSVKLFGQCKLFFSNFRIYRDILEKDFYHATHSACQYVDRTFGLSMGTADAFFAKQCGVITDNCYNMLTKGSGKLIFQCLSYSVHFFMIFGFLIITMFLLLKEMHPLLDKLQKHPYYHELHNILSCVKDSGLSYLRTEGLIMLINWGICSLALFLIGNPYFFLIGLVISIIDALPVLGSGIVLIPWGIYELLHQNIYAGIVLIITYLISVFSREILEAKLLGKGMQLNPVFTLTSIYVGIELFGAVGLFLGPIGMVLIRVLFKELVKVN